MVFPIVAFAPYKKLVSSKPRHLKIVLALRLCQEYIRATLPHGCFFPRLNCSQTPPQLLLTAQALKPFAKAAACVVPRLESASIGAKPRQPKAAWYRLN